MNQKEEVEIQLYSSLDEYEITQICTILEENNIPFIRKDAGSGSYMNLYMGQSIQEKTVFVSKNDYDRALEIIASFIGNDVEEEEIAELSEQSEDDNKVENKYKLMGRWLAILLLGIPVLMALISMILPLIYYII